MQSWQPWGALRWACGTPLCASTSRILRLQTLHCLLPWWNNAAAGKAIFLHLKALGSCHYSKSRSDWVPASGSNLPAFVCMLECHWVLSIMQLCSEAQQVLVGSGWRGQSFFRGHHVVMVPPLQSVRLMYWSEQSPSDCSKSISFFCNFCAILEIRLREVNRFKSPWHALATPSASPVSSQITQRNCKMWQSWSDKRYVKLGKVTLMSNRPKQQR